MRLTILGRYQDARAELLTMFTEKEMAKKTGKGCA